MTINQIQKDFVLKDFDVIALWKVKQNNPLLLNNFVAVISPKKISDILLNLSLSEEMLLEDDCLLQIRDIRKCGNKINVFRDINPDICWINPLYKDILNNLQCNSYLQNAMDILSKSLKIEKDENTNIRDFTVDLTLKERNALKYIIKEINQEGNLSIVKMVEEVKLSRPVFNSLFNKLEQHKIAEIKNQGKRGTNIKFILPISNILSAL